MGHGKGKTLDFRDRIDEQYIRDFCVALLTLPTGTLVPFATNDSTAFMPSSCSPFQLACSWSSGQGNIRHHVKTGRLIEAKKIYNQPMLVLIHTVLALFAFATTIYRG